MYKVLLPFTDPHAGERALRQLLKERPDALEVELLAINEAPDLTGSRRFVSHASAEEAARGAAQCWIAMLAPILQEARVPYRARVVVGRPLLEVDLALHRTDVDRVLLPDGLPRWADATSRATVAA
jgi:hypothetical protein